jgi:hypothetical protein
MKTIAKSLIAISILMISFQANAGKETNVITNTANAINYKVVVHMDRLTPSALRDVFVTMTDESGRLIAPPQLIVPGKTVYNFYEAGPVRATRIAKISNVRRPLYMNMIQGLEELKTRVFENGTTYLFNLYLEIPDAGNGGRD